MDQEGLGTLVVATIKISKEEKEEIVVATRKKWVLHTIDINKTHQLEPECLDLFHHEPLPPPYLSTFFFVGVNLFQQLLWERAQWNLEKNKLKHVINE